MHFAQQLFPLLGGIIDPKLEDANGLVPATVPHRGQFLIAKRNKGSIKAAWIDRRDCIANSFCGFHEYRLP